MKRSLNVRDSFVSLNGIALLPMLINATSLQKETQVADIYERIK